MALSLARRMWVPIVAVLLAVAGMGTVGLDVLVLSDRPTALSWWGWASFSTAVGWLLWSALAD